MGWFKQLCLSWIILSAAAVSGSCQELTSTLREGNRTCPGEEVIFTCTIRGSSTLSVIAVAWSSPEYIGQGGSLQLSTADMIGVIETSTMDGSVTATATVTNNTNINGELILESTLRITAVETSMVTCSGSNQGSASIEFTVSALPGVPQSISATEISRPIDTTCIILVQWDPPANSDASDIDQYIVYVPSRNIREVSPSMISTLTVMNCGDDIRVQVAAVNRGCVGMNSSEVQPVLLDIPTASITNGSGTTEVGSTPITSQLGAGAIAGIAIGSTIAGFCFAVLVIIAVFPCVYLLWRHLHPKEEIMPGGESHELLPKAEENVDYIWDLQKNASLEAKDCYQKQSQHDFDKLGTEKDRISVPILIDDKLDDSWKVSLHEAVKAINEAAPGLSLSITNDKEQAIINVLAIQESEPESHHTKGNILLRSASGQSKYIITIYLGKSEDDAKKGISTRELFHALGVHEDNDYGLTRFDPTSITLYQSKKANEKARKQHPGDLVWWIETKDPKLSELDKVCLNLIHRPCRGADRYTPKLGQTGLYYCGRSVMSDHTYPGDHDKYIDDICGPNYGPNCPACRTIKSEKVKEILKKQKWQGMTGRVYCGRLFTDPTEYHNGVCGMNNGPACPDCVELLNKEI